MYQNRRLEIVVVQDNPTVGDVGRNFDLAKNHVLQNSKADLVVFSECFLSGYPIEDLSSHAPFLRSVETAVSEFASFVASLNGPAVLIGSPQEGGESSYNVAYFIYPDGTKKVARKVNLPNDGVFDEVRNFIPGDLRSPFVYRGVRIGVGICEEMWHPAVARHLSGELADLLIFINGSPYRRNNHQFARMRHAHARVLENHVPLIYVNQYGGQDELVFDGASFALDSDGQRVGQCKAFSGDVQTYVFDDQIKGQLASNDPVHLYPDVDLADYSAMVLGLRDYVNKNGFVGVLLGISGGIDSAFVGAICCDALGSDRVSGYTMPGAVTSSESLSDSHRVAVSLGINIEEVPINPIVGVIRDSFGRKPRHQTTEENFQSRVRGLMLMGWSNDTGYMVVTTGNKSEMSVGYATLYGDMSGGFNPIKDLYKTGVWRLSELRNKTSPLEHGWLGLSGEVIPQFVIDKKPTAELKEEQFDEDVLGPYPILDTILNGLVEDQVGVGEIVRRLSTSEYVSYADKFKASEHVRFISGLLGRAEYKRRQSAPGVKLSSRAFGRDRRFPITNHYVFGD